MVEYIKLKHKMLAIGAGVEVCLDEFIFKAEKSGKKIYIQSGLHGGETSQWVLYRLADYLAENLEAGEVHIVPYANPLAWLQRSYFSTFGKFSLLDGKDYNRCFTENKIEDINGKICDVILRLASQADFVIDLHTSKMSNVFGIYTQKEYEKYIKILGLKYNQYSDDAAVDSLRGTFNAALDRAGIDNISIECGGHNELNSSKITKVYNGIADLLRSFGMLSGNVEVKDDVYSFEKRCKVLAKVAGLVEFCKSLGEEVTEGEVIAKIYKAGDLRTIQEVKALQSGILQIVIPSHIVWEGDTIAEIIPADNIQKL